MKKMYTVNPLSRIAGQITIPADKSISHRSVFVAALAKGKTTIHPFILSDDTKATVECMKALGVSLTYKGKKLTVAGKGLSLPMQSLAQLYAHESGTTLRILSGILAAQRFPTLFTGALPLQRRPMSRITIPLRHMGANISGWRKDEREYPPLLIQPVKQLKGIQYRLPVPSAQVKSAILFASLFAKGQTQVIEPIATRDHTERMLNFCGAHIIRRAKTLICSPIKHLVSPGEMCLPGDFSSAAFFIVLALTTPRAELLIKDVNVNQTRCGLLTVLRRMGADIRLLNQRHSFEPTADILVKTSSLRGVSVSDVSIPAMIDEIPLLAVAAARAKGITRIDGIGELRIKESDRLAAIVHNLNAIGIKVRVSNYDKGRKKEWRMAISGNPNFKTHKKVLLRSFGDHRMSMSSIILAHAFGIAARIDDVVCIKKSFPQFTTILKKLVSS